MIDKIRRAKICIDKTIKDLMKEHVVVATCAHCYVFNLTMYCKTSFVDKSPIFCGQISHDFEDKYPTEMRTNLHRKRPFFRNYTYSIANPRLPTHLPQNLSIANHYYCLFRRLRRQAGNGKNQLCTTVFCRPERVLIHRMMCRTVSIITPLIMSG